LIPTCSSAAGRPPVADALLLAAGASTRFAPHNKLLVTGADGRALIARTAAQLARAALRSRFLVLGHQADAVAQAAADPTLHPVHCADYAQGLSRSLRAGLCALPADGEAVLVCLGDMPLIEPAILRQMIEPALVDALLAAWRPGAIVVPVHAGGRGNPVLWDRGLVPDMLVLTGDQGARGLLQRHAGRVLHIEALTDAVLRDADTQAALRAMPGGPWRAPDGTPI
jgi:molybdenum cofactor cytidylyltransferase